MREQLDNYKKYQEALKKSIVYYNTLKILFDYLEKNKIEFINLSKEDLTNYFTQHEYKTESINMNIKAGKNFCKFLNIEKHVFLEMKLLKPEQRLIEYMTLEEVKQVLKYVATYHCRLNVLQTEAVLYTMFYLGLRKSELVNLKREDFDFVNGTVKIWEKKTKQENLLPLSLFLTEKITKYFNSEKEDFNAFNFTEIQVNYLFRYVISKHLGKNVKPHLARHGCGRYLAEQGVPINTIQRILGHRDIKTTLRYIEPTQKDVLRIYKEHVK